MAGIERIRVEWSGLTGLPGVSTFYATPTVPTAYAAVHAFFDDIKDRFPAGLTLSFPNFGDILEDTTGALIGTWTTTQLPPIAGSSPQPTHAAGVGARVRWNTSGVSSGNKRIRGTTFLAPLAIANYDAQGTILDATVTLISVAANLLVSDADLKIWSRPTAGAGGTSYDVISATVPDRVTSLRTRRV